MPSKSRCVAAMIRTLTAIGSLLPTGTTVRSCRQRSSLACTDERQLANFIEKQRAAVRTADESQRGRDRTGERAFDVTEELRFHQLGRERGAIDGNERPIGAATEGMDLSGGDFLAHARLAFDRAPLPIAGRSFRSGCGAPESTPTRPAEVSQSGPQATDSTNLHGLTPCVDVPVISPPFLRRSACQRDQIEKGEDNWRGGVGPLRAGKFISEILMFFIALSIIFARFRVVTPPTECSVRDRSRRSLTPPRPCREPMLLSKVA